MLYIEVKYLNKFNRKHIKSENDYNYSLKLLKYGIALEPFIPVDKDIYKTLVDTCGMDIENANSTFYKTFAEREGKTWFEVVIDRLTHYYTNGTYQPNDVDEKVFEYVNKTFKRINVVDGEIIKNELSHLVNQSLALPNHELEDLADTLTEYGVSNVTGNKDIQVILNAKNGKALKDVRMFVKQLNYTIFDDIEGIHTPDELRYRLEFARWANASLKQKLTTLFVDYEKTYGLVELSKHYRPHKKYFLVIRKYVSELKPVINKLKRLSEVNHVDHTQRTVLDMENPNFQQMTVYQLIKTRNFLSEQLSLTDNEYAQVYRVRNGKTYIKTRSPKPLNCKVWEMRNEIDSELRHRYKNANKEVYVDLTEPVSIKMPTSAKSYIGNYPMYTKITMENVPFKFGIYWSEEADIDLHAQSVTGQHIGFYSEEDSNIIYSGDMVRLNNSGMAAESMFVKDPSENNYTFSVQPYSGATTFTMFIGSENSHKTERDDIVNMNEILFTTKITDKKPITIASTVNGDIVLTNLSLGGKLPDEKNNGLLPDIIRRKERAALTLIEFCQIVGWTIVTTKTNACIDFSMTNISINSFVELLGQ